MAASELLSQYSDLTKQLFLGIQTVADTGVKSNTPLQTLAAIIALDKQLQASLDELEAHQKFQRQIESVQQQIAVEDAKVAQLAQLLQKAEQALEGIVTDAEQRLKQIGQSQEAAVTVDQLISYARRISYTTSAPPNWDERRSLTPYLPPAPDDIMIKSSLLFQAFEGRPLGPVPAGADAAATNAAPLQLMAANEAMQEPYQNHYASHQDPTQTSSNPLFDLDL